LKLGAFVQKSLAVLNFFFWKGATGILLRLQEVTYYSHNLEGSICYFSAGLNAMLVYSLKTGSYVSVCNHMLTLAPFV
jgi:hypothetical protein